MFCKTAHDVIALVAPLFFARLVGVLLFDRECARRARRPPLALWVGGFSPLSQTKPSRE